MAEIPKFSVYGEGDSALESGIQPQLPLREWGELSLQEKEIILQQLRNLGWFADDSIEIVNTVSRLNHLFLRELPGKRLHKEPFKSDSYGRDNSYERRKLALQDLQDILKVGRDALAFRALSEFAKEFIDDTDYKRAQQSADEAEQRTFLEKAYKTFDQFAACLNHIFEQFSVNHFITRSGIIPRQDKLITEQIYLPTLHALASPKWKSVNEDLTAMFEDYRNGEYAEVNTKAHSAIHRFLQLLVGEEGRNAKGELGTLFATAKRNGLLSTNQFTEQLIAVLQSFFSSERATKSTAKPLVKAPTSTDSLLMMNLVIVFLQFCLQEVG